MTQQAATERTGTIRPPVLAAPRFTGRARELARLAAALADPPAVVMVEGEAGVGKTRLIGEYLATGDGKSHQALIATCPPFRQPHTLGPLTDALRQGAADGVRGLGLSALGGVLRPLFPEWAADLPPVPEPAQDASAARHRVFAALAELFGCLETTLLVVEDAHWADDATLEFLLYLATRQPPPVSLVVTCRPEGVPASSLLPRLSSRLSPGATRLRLALGPLDVVGTAGLVSSMLAEEQVSEAFVDFLHQHTEGVPMAVEELMRLLAERGDVFRGHGGWVRRHIADIAVPPGIQDAVQEHAGRLSEDAREVLRAAAVLAHPAGEAMICAVAGLAAERARAGLCETIEAGLLGEDPRGLVSFRHVLACRAVYEAIPAPLRRVLHLRAGTALEDVPAPPVARLARHFREAGDTARWCRYSEQAAGLAVGSGDEATAVALLHDLISGAGPQGHHAIQLLDGITLASLPDTAAGCRDLVAALRSVLAAGNCPPGVEAQARFQLARLLRFMDEQKGSRTQLKLAIPRLGDPAQAARAMIMLGWPHDAVSPAAAHLRWLRRAAALTASLGPADRLRLTVERTAALLMLGREEGWAEAARIPAVPAAAWERRLITLGQLNVGDLAMMWGRYPEAERRLALAMNLAQAHDFMYYREMILSTRFHLDWFAGAWDGLAERACGLADNDQVFPGARAECALVDGLLQAAMGARAPAERRFRSALAERLRQGEMAYAMEPAAALTRMLLAEGRIQDALHASGQAVAIVARKKTWVWGADIIPARVAALAAAGRTSEAAELAASFARGLRGRKAPAPRAALLLSRAAVTEALGEHARAGVLFGRAGAAWQAVPRPYDALLARERQARCLLAAGRADDALTRLGEVFQGLAGLGARGDAVRVMGTLRQHGINVKRPWWGGRRGYGDQLSPRELEVTRLLVGGRSNREIGQVLFLSPRTVARHLEAAMRKLNVTSRAGLAERAVEAGIIPAASRAVEAT
jgi:DNA-binding CsgD family transcriptional regulator/tetratricopeptide (TPR) repeat protein